MMVMDQLPLFSTFVDPCSLLLWRGRNRGRRRSNSCGLCAPVKGSGDLGLGILNGSAYLGLCGLHIRDYGALNRFSVRYGLGDNALSLTYRFFRLGCNDL